MSTYRFRGFLDVEPSRSFYENLVNAAPQRITSDVEPSFLLDEFSAFGSDLLYVIRVEGLQAEDRVTLRQPGGTATSGVFLDDGRVFLDGRLVATATGGTGTAFEITFGWQTTFELGNGNATTLERVFEALAYGNLSDAPQPSRDLSLSVGVRDERLGYDAIRTDVVTITVEAQADAPRLVLPAAPRSLTEEEVNAGPRRLLPEATFTGDLPDKARVVLGGLADGDVIGVAGAGDGPGQIGVEGGALRFEGAAIGDIIEGEPGQFVIGLRAGVPAAAVEALLRALTFQSTSDAPAAERRITIDLLDSAGSLLGATARPIFVSPEAGAAHPFGAPDVGRQAVPVLADFDADGDVDLVVGAEDGLLHAWRNTGSGFVALLGAENPFAGIDPGRLSAPAFFDLTGDGRLDLVLGSEDRTLRVWENLPGSFKLLAGLGGPFDGEIFPPGGGFPFGTAPAFADVVGDARPDLIVAGGYDGRSLVWMNTDSGFRILLPGEVDRLDDLPLYATPAFLDVNGDGLAEVFATTDPMQWSASTAPELPLSAWDGASETPLPVPTAANPLAGIRGRVPAFGDIDGDGDLDLVVGRTDGTIDVYLNLAERPGVTVKVLPQNDPPTGIMLSGSGRVAENAAAGTVVGIVAAIDPDLLDSFTFALLGDAGGRFALQGATLVVAGPLDFEAAAEHRLTLRATDAGGFAVERHLVLAIDDVPGLLLRGGGGADSIAAPLATAEADTLVGGDGNDTLGGLGGNDRIEAGRGIDAVLFSGLRGDYRVTAVSGGFVLADQRAGAPDGTDTVLSAEVFRFADGDATADRLRLGDATAGADTRSGTGGADSIDGSGGDDLLQGLEGADSLMGEGGADVLRGAGGADRLDGGEGDDALAGGAGDDRMEGGAGRDRYWVDDAGDTVVEAAEGGLDTVTTTLDSVTLAANVENLARAGFRDFDGTGNALDNVIRGSAGRDRLAGLDGKDTLGGGAGADTLIGGLGGDVLGGGADADAFLYASTAEGKDRITDYQIAEDTIAVSASGFGGGLVVGMDLAGTDRYVEGLTGSATSAAGIGQFIYETDARRLWWDADGAGGAAARHVATLSGVATLGAAEIVVV